MSNIIRDFAERLSDRLMTIEDAKTECASIVEEAKEAGVDVKALRKIAREMVMDSDKLARKYEDEEQLSLFRDAVRIRERKGLSALEGTT